MKEPTKRTIKALFAVSGNRCAFPKCTEQLFDQPSGVVTGEICHIKSRNPAGPRYDPSQADAERHGFENLILLCSKHHTMIDADENEFTVAKLTEMKRSHEANATRTPELPAPAVEGFLDHLRNSSIIHIANAPGAQFAHTINYRIFSGPRAEQRRPAEREIQWIEQVWSALVAARDSVARVIHPAVPNIDDMPTTEFYRFISNEPLSRTAKQRVIVADNRRAQYLREIRDAGELTLRRTTDNVRSLVERAGILVAAQIRDQLIKALRSLEDVVNSYYRDADPDAYDFDEELKTIDAVISDVAGAISARSDSSSS